MYQILGSCGKQPCYQASCAEKPKKPPPPPCVQEKPPKVEPKPKCEKMKCVKPVKEGKPIKDEKKVSKHKGSIYERVTKSRKARKELKKIQHVPKKTCDKSSKPKKNTCKRIVECQKKKIAVKKEKVIRPIDHKNHTMWKVVPIKGTFSIARY